MPSSTLRNEEVVIKASDMPVYLRNLAKYPLCLQFGSGYTLILSPGEMSDEIPDAEIMDHVKITKLSEQGLLEILTAKPEAAREKNPKTHRKKSR